MNKSQIEVLTDRLSETYCGSHCSYKLEASWRFTNQRTQRWPAVAESLQELLSRHRRRTNGQQQHPCRSLITMDLEAHDADDADNSITCLSSARDYGDNAGECRNANISSRFVIISRSHRMTSSHFVVLPTTWICTALWTT